MLTVLHIRPHLEKLREGYLILEQKDEMLIVLDQADRRKHKKLELEEKHDDVEAKNLIKNSFIL